MSNKFEQLLDYLVNEEHEKANELFHEIVVEKSRQIYDSMIAEEAAEDEEDEEMDEAREEDEEDELEESFGDEESMYEIGGDAADDLVGDTEFDSDDEMDMDADDAGDMQFGGEEGGDEPATKDDILDIKDAVEELKAEFEALLAAEQNEEEGEPGIHGEPSPLDNLDDEEESDDEEGSDDEESEEDDEAYEAFVREYREVVGKPYSGGKVAGTSEDSGTNTKSPVSSAKGRPTTGATAGNIAQDQKGEDRKMGADAKSLAGSVKGEFTKGVEKNISNKANSSMKNGADLGKVPAGHGAEKKGSGESNANTKDVLPN